MRREYANGIEPSAGCREMWPTRRTCIGTESALQKLIESLRTNPHPGDEERRREKRWYGIGSMVTEIRWRVKTGRRRRAKVTRFRGKGRGKADEN